MGLIPPNNGKVFIDDIDIYKNNSHNILTSIISHVPQIIFLKKDQ